MSGDAAMLLTVAGMHLLGLVCAVALIVPALRASDPPPGSGEHGSDGGSGPPTDPPPRPGRPSGGLPLPDAVPARVRLRDHGRLSELLPGSERRPAREPQRTPVHAR